MKLFTKRVPHSGMIRLSLLLIAITLFSVEVLLPGHALPGFAATASTNPGDPVKVTDTIPVASESLVGHETFYSWSGTVDVPKGWSVLLARDTNLSKAPNDLRIYVDDIMTITTGSGSFTYDSSGGCKSAHQYLNASLSDPQQKQIAALFKEGVNNVSVALKDGCGDGKSKNSKFSTAIWMVPLLSCSNGKTISASEIDPELNAAKNSGLFTTAEIDALRNSPCDASIFDAPDQNITVSGLQPGSVLVAGPGALKVMCQDYHVETDIHYQQFIDVHKSPLVRFYMNKHVCFDGTSVTNPMQKADAVMAANNDAQFWGWSVSPFGSTDRLDEPYQIGNNPNGASRSYARGRANLTPKAGIIPLSIPGVGNFSGAYSWDPVIDLKVLGNGCYYATGLGNQQRCPAGTPYKPKR